MLFLMTVSTFFGVRFAIRVGSSVAAVSLVGSSFPSAMLGPEDYFAISIFCQSQLGKSWDYAFFIYIVTGKNWQKN